MGAFWFQGHFEFVGLCLHYDIWGVEMTELNLARLWRVIVQQHSNAGTVDLWLWQLELEISS